MGTTAPEIAVVIPTRGREARLAFALESLAGQLEPGRFEVLVVRDADAREPFAIPPPELRVRYLTLPDVAGPTAEAQPRLARHRRAAGRVHGRRLPRRPRLARRAARRRMPGRTSSSRAAPAPDPDERHLLHGLARSVDVPGPGGWFETCNMAYPRELLDRLGGFDEAFGFGGEDTDLAWRAIEAGAEPRFVDEALVWHAVVSRTVGRAVADATRWRDLPAVVARHPGLHDWLHRRHFWNREHMAIAIALAGVPLARRAPALAALAAVPYLSARINWREPHPRRIARALATMPLFATLDAIEVAARLPAAVRHRVPVL